VEDLGSYGRVISRWILKKLVVRTCTVLVWLRIRTRAG